MYQIGEKVTLEVQGENKDAEIVKIDKIFRETDNKGDFVENGLFILEEAIPTIPLPYEYHEDVITVHYPESKIAESNDRNDVTYRCKDHMFTLQIDDNQFVVSEDILKQQIR